MCVCVHRQVTVKNRAIASKMPPRFAKKQGGISMEQPEETLSTNNLGTEIWETNSTGNTIHSPAVCRNSFKPQHRMELYKNCLCFSPLTLKL